MGIWTEIATAFANANKIEELLTIYLVSVIKSYVCPVMLILLRSCERGEKDVFPCQTGFHKSMYGRPYNDPSTNHVHIANELISEAFDAIL